MTQFNFYINSLIKLIMSPLGVVLVMVGMILLVTHLRFPWVRWMLLAMCAYTCTLTGNFSNLDKYFDNTLVTPLEQIRSNGRPLSLLILGCLSCGTLYAMTMPTWRSKRVYMAMLPLAGFWFMHALWLYLGDDVVRGFATLISYGLFLLVLGEGLRRWVQTPADARCVIWAIACSGMIFVVTTLYQLAINPTAITFQNRLSGTAVNGIFAAIILVLTMLASIYLVLPEGGQAKWARVLVSIHIGFAAIFLVWTGSRTGLLMAIVGVLLMTRARLRRYFVLLVFGSVSVMLAMAFLGDTFEASTRILSTENTRAAAWSNQIREFSQSPLFGSIRGAIALEENSYLAALANFGIIGSLPLLGAVLIVIYQVIRLNASRAMIVQERLLADLTIATLCAIGTGAIFEGYLFAVFNIVTVVLVCYINILSLMLDIVDAQRHSSVGHYRAAA